MKQINFHLTDTQLRKILSTIHAYDLSIYFEEFDRDEKIRIISLLDKEKLNQLFIVLEDKIGLLDIIDDELKSKILNSLEKDELKFFISNEDPDLDKYYIYLTSINKKIIKSLLEYDADVAASIMTTDFLTIDISSSVTNATSAVIKKSKPNDYIDSIFALDSEDNYLGIINIKDLIILRKEESLLSIVDKDYPVIDDTVSIEGAITLVEDYDLKVLPVVKDKKIIGIITASDIYEELIESHEEDYEKLASIGDHKKEDSVITRVFNRLPWLLVSVVLNLIIAFFLSIFEDTLTTVIALALFQPMLLGMAGNISTQSLAVTILNLHEKEMKDINMPKKHLLNEFLIGVLNSIILSLLAFGFVFTLLSFTKFGNKEPIYVAFVVASSMFISLFVSAFIGAGIPMFFKKIGIDPAAASGPIMTTINDLFSLFVYFGFATIVFIL
ncbi:MAG: magnesium transporter [Acholeplasmatales bacterium]|jgi:magnesium transporter|nr:magnesium transporter [Acholeplasmatales bacterium]